MADILKCTQQTYTATAQRKVSKRAINLHEGCLALRVSRER